MRIEEQNNSVAETDTLDVSDPALFIDGVETLMASISREYGAVGTAALNLTGELIASAAIMYPNIASPVQLLTNIFTPKSFEYSSQNINMGSIEMVEQVHQDNVVKKAQYNMKDELNKFTYANKIMDKVPTHWQKYLETEHIEHGKSYSDSIKEVQKAVGVAEDGWLGANTLRAFIDKPTFKYAEDFLLTDEGYSVGSNMFANVPLPKTSKSGITIGGLDLANGDQEIIFASLSNVLPADVVEALRKSKDLTKQSAVDALKAIETKYGRIKLSDEEIKELKTPYLEQAVVPKLKEDLGEVYEKLPRDFLEALKALRFLHEGSNLISKIKLGYATGNWDAAIDESENYWGKGSASDTVNNRERAGRLAVIMKKWKKEKGGNNDMGRLY